MALNIFAGFIFLKKPEQFTLLNLEEAHWKAKGTVYLTWILNTWVESVLPFICLCEKLEWSCLPHSPPKKKRREKNGGGSWILCDLNMAERHNMWPASCCLSWPGATAGTLLEGIAQMLADGQHIVQRWPMYNCRKVQYIQVLNLIALTTLASVLLSNEMHLRWRLIRLLWRFLGSKSQALFLYAFVLFHASWIPG